MAGKVMEIEIKKVKLSSIKLNKDNPRRISDKDMERLLKSLQEFPEMMSLREIVVDENMTVLGGNMRTLALRKSGEKECVAKIVKGFTEQQKREFMEIDPLYCDVIVQRWEKLTGQKAELEQVAA